MRTFIVAITFYLLDHLKVPVATGVYMELIVIGFLMAIVQDVLEIFRFFRSIK